MNKNTGDIIFRTLLFVGLFLAVFLIPSWITFGLAILPLFWYRQYPELFAIVILLDVVYAPSPVSGALLGSVLYSVLGVVLYAIIFFIKKRLFMYRN